MRTDMRDGGRRFGIMRPALAIAVAALATGVGACGGSSESSGSKSGGTAAGGTQALAVAIGAEPGSLDPLLKSDGPRDTFSLSVYEGLTARQGGSKVVPALAESYKQAGKKWIFTLRQGVKFHDGSPMTSGDVVASWKRILSDKSELLGNTVDKDTKVTAPDDKTVVISRPVQDPTIPVRASLVMIAPKAWAALSDDRLTDQMDGTGPYKFLDWNKGKNIDLQANEDYWGTAPTIKKVDVRFDPEASVRVAALQAGEIQMALNMSPDLAKGDFSSVASPASEVLIIRLNSQHGAFQDKRLREAANLAIDRQALIKQLYGGYAKSAQGQEITDAVFGFDKNQTDFPYDPAKAKSLLQQAGAVGTKVVLSGTKGHWANDAEVAQAVAGMLDKVGFKTDLKIPVFSEWVKEIFVAEDNDAAAPDMSIYNHSNQLFDASLTLGQNLTCAGTSSTTCIKSVDKLADEASHTTDTAKRQELYDQAWQQLKDNAAFVSIANVYHLSFLKKGLDWKPPVDGFLRFQEMSFKS